MLLEHPEYSAKIFGACKVTDKLKTFSWSLANSVVSGYLQLRSGKLEGAYKLLGTNRGWLVMNYLRPGRYEIVIFGGIETVDGEWPHTF